MDEVKRGVIAKNLCLIQGGITGGIRRDYCERRWCSNVENEVQTWFEKEKCEWKLKSFVGRNLLKRGKPIFIQFSSEESSKCQDRFSY